MKSCWTILLLMAFGSIWERWHQFRFKLRMIWPLIMDNTEMPRCSEDDTKRALDSFKRTTVLQDLTSLESQVIVITGGLTCVFVIISTYILSGGGDGIGQALVRAVLE